MENTPTHRGKYPPDKSKPLTTFINSIRINQLMAKATKQETEETLEKKIMESSR